MSLLGHCAFDSATCVIPGYACVTASAALSSAAQDDTDIVACAYISAHASAPLHTLRAVGMCTSAVHMLALRNMPGQVQADFIIGGIM